MKFSWLSMSRLLPQQNSGIGNGRQGVGFVAFKNSVVKNLKPRIGTEMLARPITHPLENIPASFPSGLRWYVFCAFAKAEKRAEESIRDLGYPVFVPFEKKIRRKPGCKPRIHEGAYLPGYGFVQFDINDQGWGAIVEADGVIDILRTTSVPRALPDAVIDELRLADSMGLLDATKPPKAGIEVEVTDGPFSSLIGKVMRARSGDRADVLFKGIFGGARTINLPLAFLKER